MSVEGVRTDAEPVRHPGREGRRPVALPAAPARLLRTPEAILVVVAWLTVTTSQLGLSLSREKMYTPITGGTREVEAWADTLSTVCDAVLMLTCVALVLTRFRTIEWRTLPLLALLLAPWVVLVTRTAGLERSLGVATLPYLALAVTFWVLRPRLAVIELTGYLTGLTAVLSLALGALVPWAGTFEGAEGSAAEKPIGPFGILAGTMPTGNNLGGALVVGLAAVLTIRHTVHRRCVLAVTVLAIVWTFSRTTWLAVAVLALALGGLWLTRRRPVLGGRGPEVLAGTTLAGLALVVTVLPFLVQDPTSFNNRAGFWMFTLDDWRQEWLLGYGVDYYARLAEAPENLGGFAYHAHNLTVQLLVTGGVVLTLCAAVLLTYAAVRAVRLAGHGQDWAVLFLLTVLVVAVLEVPVSFADNIKANSATMIPLLVLLTARRANGRGPEPGTWSPAGGRKVAR